MKVCDKTCIFCFFPIINKYLCMAKRSLLSEQPSYLSACLPVCLYLFLFVCFIGHLITMTIAQTNKSIDSE